jgi:hypothetical protein
MKVAARGASARQKGMHALSWVASYVIERVSSHHCAGTVAAIGSLVSAPEQGPEINLNDPLLPTT